MAISVAFSQGMTVKDLRECLDELDDDKLVFLSKDPEGNKFYRLHLVEIGIFNIKTMECPAPEDKNSAYYSDADLKRFEKDPNIEEVAVLWP